MSNADIIAAALDDAVARDTPEDWECFGRQLGQFYGERNIGSVCLWSFAMLPPAGMCEVREAITRRHGPPERAPLADLRAAAEQWAAWSDPEELRAYAMAILEAMSPDMRARFARYVSQPPKSQKDAA